MTTPMESSKSFSQLVADFKSQLEKQDIHLKGQLIFTFGESPEVNVVFKPSIEQYWLQNSYLTKDTSAFSHISSATCMFGSGFDIKDCPIQNNDIPNRSFPEISSQCDVEQVFVMMHVNPNFENKEKNLDTKKAHSSEIDSHTDSGDNKATGKVSPAHNRVGETEQATFESGQKSSADFGTINDNLKFKKSDLGSDFQVKDLNKLSHSQLVSILTDILKSKTDHFPKAHTEEKRIEIYRNNSTKSPEINSGSRWLEIKKTKDEKNILEDNSNICSDKRNRKSIKQKSNIGTSLHLCETPDTESSDYFKLNKRKKIILKNQENDREKNINANIIKSDSFKTDSKNCSSIAHRMQDIQKNKKDNSDITKQNDLVKIKPKKDNKKCKTKLKYSCRECSCTFSNNFFYKRHLCRDSSRFQCDICGKKLKSKDSLYHHWRGLHAPKKQYSCQQCNISFNFYHSYKLHVQKHKGQRPFQCQVCRKTYLTSNHLKVHVEATHKVQKNVCHVCGKTFSYSCSLKTHLQKHLTEKPFKCDICDKRFTSSQSLKAHHLSHDPAKNFFCDICGNSYKSEHSKNVHMKHHSKQKRQYICELCGKTFHFKSTLTAHLNVHSKAKPYLCPHCGKGFKSKAALYTHKFTHKDTQSYACTTCGKTFKTKNCCAAHMKRHSNQLNLTCDICGSTFPDKGGLTKHIRTIHEPSKQYVCKICGKRGTRADNMRTHVKNHNKELNESTNPMDFILEEIVSETQMGFNTVRPRIRGPKQRRSKSLPITIKDVVHDNEIKYEPHADNFGSLDLSNQFKLQLGPLPSLQANLLSLPLMDSFQYNSHLSYITGDTFLKGDTDTQNSDDVSMVQVNHQTSQLDSGLFQHEVNKTFCLELMHTQSNDLTVSDSLNFNPMENLLSVMNSEQDSSINHSSISPQACHEAVDLDQQTSSGHMHQLAVSCMYSDADVANITPLDEILEKMS